MNDDTKSERIEPELEARIVALVLGEASDFERVQLTELIAAREDLQSFYREMIALHDWLPVAASRESVGQDEVWRLPEQRRESVKAVISSEPNLRTKLAVTQDRWRSSPHRRRWMLGLVATLVFTLAGVGIIQWSLSPQYALRTADMRTLDAEASVAMSAPAAHAERRSGAASRFVTPKEHFFETTQSQQEVVPEDGPESTVDALALPAMDKVEFFERDFDFRQGESLPQTGAASTSTFRNKLSDVREEQIPAAPPSGPMMSGGAVATSEPSLAYGLPGAVTRGGQAPPEPASQPVPPSPLADPAKKEAASSVELSMQPEGLLDADFDDRFDASDRPLSGLADVSGAKLAEEEKVVEQVEKDFAARDGVERKQLRSRSPHNIPLTSKPQAVAPIALEELSRDLSSAEIELQELFASEEPFSTFSLHVSDVSFKLAANALSQGQWPDPSTIRIEEFVNALDYGDPLPSLDEKVACEIEQAIHPFLQQRNLLRIAMRTATVGRAGTTPLRLTCLLDNSGSMERMDRQETVRRAFALLAAQLRPDDQITLISFAREPRLLADRVPGNQASRLVELIADLPSEGGTNLESALTLAFEKAREQYVSGAQNRIVLLTDGAVNLGNANPQTLSQMIVEMRDAGFAFDAAGIVADGLSDDVLEALTRQGDGRYYLLDTAESADDGFARQLAGALRPAAKNVKVQVEFNPQRVGRYRLLGFEKHRLNKEDFRNDSVDAAELAAEETGVAVYQFEAKPEGEGDVGSVAVRFQDVATGRMVENRWPITYQPFAPRLTDAEPEIRIASVAALLAMKLRGEQRSENVEFKALSQIIAELPERYRRIERVQQLQTMIQQAMQIQN